MTSNDKIKTVQFPPGLKYIETNVFCESIEIKKFTFLSPEPPVLNVRSLVIDAAGDIVSVPIFVPSQSLELYRNAPGGWEFFAKRNLIYPIDIGDHFEQDNLRFDILSEEDNTVAVGLTGNESVLDYFKSVRIPESIKYAGRTFSVVGITDYGFSSLQNLEYIDVPNSVTFIGDYAFSHCPMLQRIDIPNKLKSVNGTAFMGCHSLETFNGKYCTGYFSDGPILYTKDLSEIVSYPSAKGEVSILTGVRKIGRYAFAESLVRSVIISKYMETVDATAFFGCGRLWEILCLAQTPPAIEGEPGTLAFDNDGELLNCNIYVPSQSLELYKSAPGWNKYKNRIFPLEQSGIGDISSDTATESLEVYSIDGRFIMRSSDASSLRSLDRGLYIINGKKVYLP